MSENSVDVRKLSFEEALDQLEQLVGRLDAGELPLAEAIDNFKLAMELRMHCARLLDEAEASIEELQAPDAATQPGAVEMSDDSEDSDPFAGENEDEEANLDLFGDNPFDDG